MAKEKEKKNKNRDHWSDLSEELVSLPVDGGENLQSESDQIVVPQSPKKSKARPDSNVKSEPDSKPQKKRDPWSFLASQLGILSSPIDQEKVDMVSTVEVTSKSRGSDNGKKPENPVTDTIVVVTPEMEKSVSVTLRVPSEVQFPVMDEPMLQTDQMFEVRDAGNTTFAASGPDDRQQNDGRPDGGEGENEIPQFAFGNLSRPKSLAKAETSTPGFTGRKNTKTPSNVSHPHAKSSEPVDELISGQKNNLDDDGLPTVLWQPKKPASIDKSSPKSNDVSLKDDLSGSKTSFSEKSAFLRKESDNEHSASSQHSDQTVSSGHSRRERNNPRGERSKWENRDAESHGHDRRFDKESRQMENRQRQPSAVDERVNLPETKSEEPPQKHARRFSERYAAKEKELETFDFETQDAPESDTRRRKYSQEPFHGERSQKKHSGHHEATEIKHDREHRERHDAIVDSWDHEEKGQPVERTPKHRRHREQGEENFRKNEDISSPKEGRVNAGDNRNRSSQRQARDQGSPNRLPEQKERGAGASAAPVQKIIVSSWGDAIGGIISNNMSRHPNRDERKGNGGRPRKR